MKMTYPVPVSGKPGDFAHSIRIFVYGTLMKGEGAHHLLSSAKCLGTYCLSNYALYDLGSFPGIRPYRDYQILGEVYEVSRETLEQLDRYESEGSLYDRKRVSVYYDDETLEVDTYVYHSYINGTAFSGKWNQKASDPVWYACYGSSLDAERFACYIEGGTCKANGRYYSGCTDKTLWTESMHSMFGGGMYYGNSSSAWNGKGVSFYDIKAPGFTFMRLYKITMGQLLEIQVQEGASNNWYGNLLCLGVNSDHCPIYTLTSVERRPENEPDPAYLELMKKAMVEQCGYSEKMADAYLRSRM